MTCLEGADLLLGELGAGGTLGPQPLQVLGLGRDELVRNEHESLVCVVGVMLREPGVRGRLTERHRQGTATTSTAGPPPSPPPPLCSSTALAPLPSFPSIPALPSFIISVVCPSVPLKTRDERCYDE
ncbi:hypothetical protein E2C01_017964 [Portunus trituberculatus]|uniref:Uncharacterized protein n=1 Tax=Portunus trituberculatus TaxID=210409 RepID=A0A5B7DUY9_PORTR|nr:hypothetical protein [Portunus trituberculatus]